MTNPSYQNNYPNINMHREDGILQVQFHTNGGPLAFSVSESGFHTQLGDAFREIGRDPDNLVVILTGTGNVFCNAFDGTGATGTPEFFDRMFKEGRDMLMNLLDIEVPVIGVFNGPALIHAELVAMSDIVLATDDTEIADVVHFTANTVPGDGVHVFWPMVLGVNRGRYFLLTGERIPAEEAKRLGVVAEVLPRADVLPRAWEIARTMIKLHRLTLRYTRTVLAQPLKRRMLEELGYGLALEFTASGARRADAAKQSSGG